MSFYSATGKLINKSLDLKKESDSVKQSIEYKANGILIIENDDKVRAAPRISKKKSQKMSLANIQKNIKPSSSIIEEE